MSTTLVNPGVNILVHQSHTGDARFSRNEMHGIRKPGQPIEGFCLELTDRPKGLTLEYMANMDLIGDTDWRSEGSFVGSRGQNLALQGIAIRLKGPQAAKFQVRYKVNMGQFGDTEWTSSGVYCGTRKQNRPIEGIRINIRPRKTDTPSFPDKEKAFFEATKKFNTWHDFNGPNKIGIKLKTTDKLNRFVRSYRGKLAEITGGMESVINLWRKMPIANGTESVRILVGKISRRFEIMIEQADQLSTNIAGVESELLPAIIEINSKRREHQRREGEIQKRIQQGTQALIEATRKLAQEKSKSRRNNKNIQNAKEAIQAVKKQQHNNLHELKEVKRGMEDVETPHIQLFQLLKLTPYSFWLRGMLENIFVTFREAKEEEDYSLNHKLLWEHYQDQATHDIRDLQHWLDAIKLSQ